MLPSRDLAAEGRGDDVVRVRPGSRRPSATPATSLAGCRSSGLAVDHQGDRSFPGRRGEGGGAAHDPGQYRTVEAVLDAATHIENPSRVARFAYSLVTDVTGGQRAKRLAGNEVMSIVGRDPDNETSEWSTIARTTRQRIACAARKRVLRVRLRSRSTSTTDGHAASGDPHHCSRGVSGATAAICIRTSPEPSACRTPVPVAATAHSASSRVRRPRPAAHGQRQQPGAFGLPRNGCGVRNGASVSTSTCSIGDDRGRLAQRRRVLERDHAGEGEDVAGGRALAGHRRVAGERVEDDLRPARPPRAGCAARRRARPGRGSSAACRRAWRARCAGGSAPAARPARCGPSSSPGRSRRPPPPAGRRASASSSA